MGSEQRLPSGRIGLAMPPLRESHPFRLRMIFTTSLVAVV
jgi:hypothetical protein